MRINGDGPIPSRIMLVGEAPSESDERSRVPFGGSSGQELNRLLHEAGIMKTDCYVTYVCKSLPSTGSVFGLVATKKKDITPAHILVKGQYVLPEVAEGMAELFTEIAMVQPNVIVALGNLALWTLTGHWSVAKWRGSLLRADRMYKDQQEWELPKVIPTYPPSQVYKQFELRAVILNDYRRVKRHMVSRTYDNIPAWNFIIRPSLSKTLETLNMLLKRADETIDLWLEFDLETFITNRQIRCAGISWSKTDAICIPFTDGYEAYWPEEQEAIVLFTLYKLLTHRNVKVRGQNLLFDCQYTYRYWHFIPRVAHDTMISQHSCFAAMPKGLDFLASMYADYFTNWKMEEHS